jgi:hypothetical protein
MPTIALEIDEVQREPVRSLRKKVLPAKARIGSGVALATPGGSGRWKDNPYHWQTLILLIPLRYNETDSAGYRKPIPELLIKRTIQEMREMFSGYTLLPAKGWYWDDVRIIGVSDDLVRIEVDGIFTGDDLHTLHDWKKRLRRRFKQNYIYMRLVASGVAI